MPKDPTHTPECVWREEMYQQDSGDESKRTTKMKPGLTLFRLSRYLSNGKVITELVIG